MAARVTPTTRRALTLGRRAWRSTVEAARSVRLRGARMATNVGLTPTGQGALAAAAALWIAARIVAGTTVYLIAYGLLALVLIGRLVAPRRISLEAARLGLGARLMEGDTGTVDLELQAGRRTSLVVLEEQIDVRLGPPVRVALESVRPGDPWLHRYRVRAHRRGEFTVGPLTAVTNDPLGLTRHAHELVEAETLIVHPRVETLSTRLLTRQLEDPPVRPPVSQPWPSGLEFHGMREYVAGDDLRRVVWRASAKTGQVMVREAEQGVTDRVTIVLDTVGAHHTSPVDGASTSFEAAVRAAASLAVHYLRRGLQITVLTGDGALTRPLRGSHSQIEALDALARLTPGRDGVASALARLAVGARDDHVIVITARLRDEDAVTLRSVMQRGTSALVLLVERSETDGGVDAASGVGCQVVSLAPGQSLAEALAAEIGPGVGR